ncbi:MAG: hypothetical protein IPK52_00385 [Chloroflexi bacterium]|nr:hypothetical protein [Chloroflexota bacterium]
MPPTMRHRVQARLTSNIAIARDLASKRGRSFEETLRLYKLVARIQADTAALSQTIPDDLTKFVA